MSILSDKTEVAVIRRLAHCLKYFDSLEDLKMTSEDAFAARAAENQIKSIIETRGYRAEYNPGLGTVIQKIKS
jgi:hypothetical protein